MPLINEVQQAWRENGEFFGYPECCINWFIERGTKLYTISDMNKLIEAAEVPKNQQNYIHGFIPCPKCAEKVVPGREGELIKNRKCPTPYPDDSGSGIE